MTSQEDITAFLKAKLEDRNPKCANCMHWDRSNQDAPDEIRSGVCTFNTFRREDKFNPSVAVSIITRTTDLSLCSAWESNANIDPENPPLTDEQLSRFKRRNLD